MRAMPLSQVTFRIRVAEDILPGAKQPPIPPLFFPKLSNTEQRFIPNWPIIRKFNQRSKRSSRKNAIA
jgi:hypothetical protein